MSPVQILTQAGGTNKASSVHQCTEESHGRLRHRGLGSQLKRQLLVISSFSGRWPSVASFLGFPKQPMHLDTKRGPGLGSFSRAERGIGGVRHVAPPT